MKTKIIIKSPQDIVPYLMKYAKKKQEHFGVVFLDSGLNVLDIKIMFIGGTNKATIDRKIIFWEAARRCASGMIIFHNHPSGTLNPSDEDSIVTKEINQASDIIGIQLLDHIIVTRMGYYSFKEHASDSVSII